MVQTELVVLVSKPLMLPVARSSRRPQACATIAFCLALSGGPFPPSAAAQTPSSDELVAWLENRETEWVATAHLQTVPEAALPLLLQPGRVRLGPHARWSSQMLALAKLGEPAIASITERAIAIVKTGDYGTYDEARALINVLGSMGPAAVPGLLQIAEAGGVPPVTVAALDEIVTLEPRTRWFGQLLSPWTYWRPADDRLDELRRELTPLLPRVRKLMERTISEWKPQRGSPQRPAAYLLARWGTGEARARGLQVLEELARANEPFYYNLDSIRLLHDLEAPQTASLIRAVAARVPDANDLKAQYLLSMAVALHQLGDRDYASMLSAALGAPRPYVRMEAAQFVASAGEISHVELLIPLLDDREEWNRRTVAQVAVESLQRLTFEQLGPDAHSWRAWFEANRNVSRATLVARRVKAHLAVVREVPIEQATRWMSEFSGSDGAALLPLIDAYLDRRDLNAGIIGGGGGPSGVYGPRVITLLLDLTIRQVPGALQRLIASLEAAAPDVRTFGSLALSAFDRPRALERLAIEATRPESWQRRRASEFLLELGDKRGIAARLEGLVNNLDAARMFACRDLRVYTQQPLPCDAAANAVDRATNVSTWHAWWERAEPTFRVKAREAALDLRAYPLISPVRIGNQPVR